MSYFSPTLTTGEIEEHLLALKSPDYATRRIAFQALLPVPKEYLAAAWKRSRGLLPLHGGSLDCFGRVEVVQPTRLQFERAIVTVVSPDYEALLRQLLDSLRRVGETAPVVVFAVNESFETIANWEGVVPVRCFSRERLDASVKGAVYSCARWIKATHIVAMECDMVAIESLEPLWTTIEQADKCTMAGCRPQAFRERLNTLQWVINSERQQPTALEWLGEERFAFNGGLMAGDYAAWQKLDELLTGLGEFGFVFLDGGMKRTYGEECLMNWAVNRLNRIELHPGWNVQFFTTARDRWLTTLHRGGRRVYECHSFPANVLHFMGGVRSGRPSLMEVILKEMKQNPLLPSNMIQCLVCRVRKTCGNCFEPTTFAVERLANGARSAVCKPCFEKQQGKTQEEIDGELLEVAFELKQDSSYPEAPENL